MQNPKQCPYCDSEDIGIDDCDAGSDKKWKTDIYECYDCHGVWTLEYKLETAYGNP